MQVLSEQAQTVDFAHYRSILKNTAIVDDIEKQVNSYQIKKFDVNRQLKAIDAFEAQAVKSAEETKGKVDTELKDLEKTLQNIESARPFEDLTTVCSREEMDGIHLLMYLNRMMSRPPDQMSRSVQQSLYLRDDGESQATRFVLVSLGRLNPMLT